MSLVNDLPPTLPLLLFATSDLPATKIPYDLAVLFSVSCEQVSEFIRFLSSLFGTASLRKC